MSTPGEFNEVYKATVDNIIMQADALFADEVTQEIVTTATSPLRSPAQGMVILQTAGEHSSPAHISLQTIEVLDMEPLSEEQQKIRQRAFRLVGMLHNGKDNTVVDFMGITVEGHAFMGSAPYTENIQEQIKLVATHSKAVDYDANNIDYDAERDGPSIEEVAARAGTIMGYLYLQGVNTKAPPPEKLSADWYQKDDRPFN